MYLRDGDLYILDDQTTEKRLFFAGIDTGEVSPNGYWIAYEIEDRDTNRLTAIGLIAADGEAKGSIPVRGGEDSLLYWLDNERVILQDLNSRTLTVLNMFTGQATQLDYSSYSIYLRELPHYGPPLSRAVFLQSTETEGLGRLVLVNVQNGQTLWSWEVLVTKFGAEEDIAWAPDGSRFVVGLQPVWPDPTGYGIRYLYAVTRDGAMEQLTYYQKPQATIKSPGWSPDGRYVAFWYGNRLAVFDTVTSVITDYCLYTDETSQTIRWSPDSRLLIVNVPCRQGGCLTIVDVKNEKAVKVKTRGYTIGWIARSP